MPIATGEVPRVLWGKYAIWYFAHAKLCRKYKLVQTSDHSISANVPIVPIATREVSYAQRLHECLGANMQAGISLLQSTVQTVTKNSDMTFKKEVHYLALLGDSFHQ